MTPTYAQFAASIQPFKLSIRLTSECPHGKPSRGCCGNAQWMRVIHAINASVADVEPRTELPISTPLATYAQSGDRWFEEYPEFRVILGRDNANYVQAKTDAAAKMLHDAALEVTGIDFGPDGMAR